MTPTASQAQVAESPIAVRPAGLPSRDDLDAQSRLLEATPPSGVIAWAHEQFGDGLVLAASFQDCVLIDIAAKVVPDIEVVFLDTQYHFAETHWYVDEVKRRYDLNLTVMQPRVMPDNLWQTDVDACCNARKVEPLSRALEGRAAWMGGLKRDDGPSRADTPVVHWDERRGLVKVNPLATWTDLDVAGYVRDHDLPVHPLATKGYPSIGCWPCTNPVAPGQDARSGRWADDDKTECGINE